MPWGVTADNFTHPNADLLIAVCIVEFWGFGFVVGFLAACRRPHGPRRPLAGPHELVPPEAALWG